MLNECRTTEHCQRIIKKQIISNLMAPVNCIKFSYLGTTRYVICDLDTNYTQMQRLVALTFRLPEECISAIQFTDGRGYLFNKDLFEYFLILFPQPEQTFYVRLECSKIIEYRIARKEGKSLAPAGGIVKDNNKRKLRDIQETEDRFVHAAPLRRQNCFMGALPDGSDGMDGLQSSDANAQPRKRLRLMKTNKKAMKKFVKPPQAKKTLRL